MLLLLLLPPKRGQNKDKLAINTSRKDDTAASREREREREVLVSLGSGDLESKCMGCVNACVRVRACERA